VLCQVVSQIFGTRVYAITSNAGEIALLLGTSFTLLLVQKDLALAGSFADFLHRSNIAFRAPVSGPGRRASVAGLGPQAETKTNDAYKKVPSGGQIELTNL